MRERARASGRPEMYIGTEGGCLLQHVFAQGHNFSGINPGNLDNQFENVKRLILGQIAYDFPGSRAFFNYVLTDFHQEEGARARIFGQVLGLAFPRFSLAPFTFSADHISYYLVAGVKKAFRDHYRSGTTVFPAEMLEPGAPPPASVALVLKSLVGKSIHFASLAGEDITLAREGYRVRLEHGRALLVDSFGNLMGETGWVQWQEKDYFRLGRPASFGLWRSEDGPVYLKVLEKDQAPLQKPGRIFLSAELLHRLGRGNALRWSVLDQESTPSPATVETRAEGIEIHYPDDPACRCLIGK